MHQSKDSTWDFEAIMHRSFMPSEGKHFYGSCFVVDTFFHLNALHATIWVHQLQLRSLGFACVRTLNAIKILNIDLSVSGKYAYWRTEILLDWIVIMQREGSSCSGDGFVPSGCCMMQVWVYFLEAKKVGRNTPFSRNSKNWYVHVRIRYNNMDVLLLTSINQHFYS
jgi:hypothetical protein